MRRDFEERDRVQSFQTLDLIVPLTGYVPVFIFSTYKMQADWLSFRLIQRLSKTL